MGRRKRRQQPPSNEGRSHQPRLVEHIDEDDPNDEEIDSDGDDVFNSDDERKYGSFFDGRQQKSNFKRKRSGTDDKDDSSDEEISGSDRDDDDDDDKSDSSGCDDDDDEEGVAGSDDDSQAGDGGQYMLDLLEQIDKKPDEKAVPPSENNHPHRNASQIAAHVKESQFSSTILPRAGLTLDALMEGLEDTKGFGLLQKAMKQVSTGKATSAPLAHVKAHRAERKVHYEDQVKEMSQWNDAVQENRKAETLDFTPKFRLDVTQDVLIEKFVPTTNFERQLHQALQEAGQQDDATMLKREEQAILDDLGHHGITLEEFKERRSQLAKIRALLFYQEQKQHKINKIKSKKYRRIRKKQRERQKRTDAEAQVEENPDLIRELEEKEELERMKERMTLAHKNTSKWAKRILKRGKNVDADTRKALSAQLKRGDDLLSRMNSTRDGVNGENDSDSDNENLVDLARKVLNDTENAQDADAAQEESGLFKLAFMQKGIERQRQRAREEARELLLELEANERDTEVVGSSDDDDDHTRRDTHQEKTRKKKAKFASKEEMKHILPDGELAASSLQFGTSVSISGAINLDGDATKTSKGQQGTKLGALSETTLDLPAPSRPTAAPPPKPVMTKSVNAEHPQLKATIAPTAKAVKPHAAGDVESNPWLVGQLEGSDGKTHKVQGTTHNDSERLKKRAFKDGSMNRTAGSVDVDRAVELLHHNQTKENDDTKSRAVSSRVVQEDSVIKTKPLEAAAGNTTKITKLSQEELVRRAFASAGDDTNEDEEFAKEKAMVEDEEQNPTRKRPNKEKDLRTTSGWGSWAGAGAPPLPLAPLTRKIPQHLQPPSIPEPNQRRRHDMNRRNVIIRQRRLKKMADQFMIANVPHPFAAREEYERSMIGGIGREWNVTQTFVDRTRPEIITRAGKIIQPLSKKAKQNRPAAKF